VLLRGRGPRVLVGAALSVAGTAFQGLFRNLISALFHPLRASVTVY
jgi:ABC-type enterobactin transport system permease subunit